VDGIEIIVVKTKLAHRGNEQGLIKDKFVSQDLVCREGETDSHGQKNGEEDQ
jgi:hypothetical protein